MYLIASVFILTTMTLSLLRAFAGPTLFDRILAVNVFGTKTVLFVAVISVSVGNSSFLDVAMVYALINFISIIAVLRFFEENPFAEQEEEK